MRSRPFFLSRSNVVFAVQPPTEAGAGGAIAGVLANLAFPLLIIGGLILPTVPTEFNGTGDTVHVGL